MSRLVQFIRSVHYKPLKKYPVVNAKDVELTPAPKTRLEDRVLLSQTVKNHLFPATEIAKLYKDNNKPVPRKFKVPSEEISRKSLEAHQEAISMGEPHFRVGEKQIYFPKARVILLRPNAKHTPYQAKFLVPRNFNKFDLRDYLWNVYGLRALNVTTQLMWAKWKRGAYDYSRYRGPQYKKMTIDMEEPFVWPVLPEGLENSHKQANFELQERSQLGKNEHIPEDLLDGAYTKPKLANIYVPKRVREAKEAELKTYNEKLARMEKEQLVAKFLNI